MPDFAGGVALLDTSPRAVLRGAEAYGLVEVQVRSAGEILVVDVAGKILGGSESDSLRTAVDQILQGNSRKVLVNLAGVPWMNSSGLGILLSGYSRLRDRGGSMGFFGVQERVREILETTKLITVLGIFADEETGLRALASGGVGESAGESAEGFPGRQVSSAD